jgi:hypothetical protein
MPKLILTTEAQGKVAAESSAAPIDFANASPFRERGKDRDPTRTAVLAAAGVALLTFLGSMIAVLLMHAPKP